METEEQIGIVLSTLSANVACPRCGTRLRYGDFECPHCGTDVEDVLRELARSVLDRLSGGQG